MTEFNFPQTSPQPSAGPSPRPPAAPQPPKRSKGWKILAILMLLLLVVSVFVNVILFVLFAAAVGGSGGGAKEHVAEETIISGSSDKIAILPVEGAVDDSMVERVHWFCDRIKDDTHIKAVVIEVNSPGGGITASDEIHHLFTDLRTNHNKKLVVSMGALAASGGYYVSMPAEKLYAERTTLTGSIGVIWPAFEVADLMTKIGVTPEIIKSSQASEFKDAGSPFRKFDEKDRAYIRELVNHAHGQFQQVVEEGRKGRLTESIDKIAIGKIWSAEEAKAKGLIDDICYLDEVITRTAHDAGLTNPTVIRLKKRSGFFEALNGASPMSPGKVEVKVDAESIRSSLQEATGGRLEYRYMVLVW